MAGQLLILKVRNLSKEAAIRSRDTLSSYTLSRAKSLPRVIRKCLTETGALETITIKYLHIDWRLCHHENKRRFLYLASAVDVMRRTRAYFLSTIEVAFQCYFI